MSRLLSLKHADKSEEIEITPATNKNHKIPIVWDKNDNNQDMKQKSYEDVLKKRKERFGEVSPPKPKYQKFNRQITNINTLSANELNLLKKRRERFGESVSTLLKQIEQKDRMMKRQARFSCSKLNVEVFQHTPSSTVQLFKTIDQIDAEERGKIKLEK